jgi:flagellar biosynthetic protein FliP
MRADRTARMIAGVGGLLFLAAPTALMAQGHPGFGLEIGAGSGPELSSALRILLALTVISLIPAALVAMTSFTRIVIVLSMLRQALGMQDTPPNMVLIGMALFLTLFTMLPVAKSIESEALAPYLDDRIPVRTAVERAIVPLRQFMVRHTRESDLKLIVEISDAKLPDTIDDIQLVDLVPAFMLSELRSAFQIGFVIFLPFLLIDIVVASVLMSMGMLMVPPVVISLPIKILTFVLIDGWSLVVKSLVGSFY